MSVRIIERGSTPHRVYQVVGWAVFVGLVALITYGLADFRIAKFSLAGAFAVAILGLNLVTGFSGQVSLGHSAFFGIGAYTTAILMVEYDWPFYLTLVPSALIGALVGLIVGFPALRIRGLYLALVTLAIAVVFPTFVKWVDSPDHLWGWIKTGGPNGKTVNEVSTWQAPGWMPGDVSSDAWRFLNVVLIGGLMFWLASNLTRSRTGRGLLALRDNEIGAAVSGVYPAGNKVLAFAYSAGYAAVGGSLYVLAVGTVSADTFGLLLAIQFIAGLVIGGIATLVGSLLGGLFIEFVPYYTSTWLEGPRANVLLGLILIGVIFVAPGGLVYLIRLLRSKFVVFTPRLPAVSRPRGDATTTPTTTTAADSAPVAVPSTSKGE